MPEAEYEMEEVVLGGALGIAPVYDVPVIVRMAVWEKETERRVGEIKRALKVNNGDSKPQFLEGTQA
jgi:hypothetical protein